LECRDRQTGSKADQRDGEPKIVHHKQLEDLREKSKDVEEKTALPASPGMPPQKDLAETRFTSEKVKKVSSIVLSGAWGVIAKIA